MTIEATLERIATAIEKQNELTLEMLRQGVPDALEAQADLAKTEPLPADAVDPLGADENPELPEEPQEKEDPKKGDDLNRWNPYDHDIQKAYRADKQAILDEECEVLGIDITKLKTGAQKHQAILDHNGDNAPDVDPLEAEPKVEEKRKREPNPPKKVKKEEVRDACLRWAKRNGQDKFFASLEAEFGVKTLADLDESVWPEVIDRYKGVEV